MPQPTRTVKWPVIIKLDADDELIFITDADEFANDTALREMHLQVQDKLIDCTGAVFTISNRSALTLTAKDSMLSLDAVEACYDCTFPTTAPAASPSFTQTSYAKR